MSNDGVCSCCEREGLVLLLSSSFQQETKNPFMKETEKRRGVGRWGGAMGAEFWMNKWGRWRNKKKIQRWWKVPRSFKCANMRFSVGTATGQATYLLANPCDDTKESSGGETPRKPDRRWYQQQKQYSTSEGEKKRTGLNSKISVRWQIGLFAFRYWHC